MDPNFRDFDQNVKVVDQNIRGFDPTVMPALAFLKSPSPQNPYKKAQKWQRWRAYRTQVVKFNAFHILFYRKFMRFEKMSWKKLNSNIFG